MANKPQSYFTVTEVKGPFTIEEIKKIIAAGSIDEDGEAVTPPTVLCGKLMKYATEVTFERPARKPREAKPVTDIKSKAKK